MKFINIDNPDIVLKLRDLTEFLIMKGGKKNTSKLIKVKRPFKTKSGKIGYRDTWVLPGQVKSDEKIHNEHKLHHKLPKEHPDYKKKELHPNFVAGRDKHLEARKKPKAEAPNEQVSPRKMVEAHERAAKKFMAEVSKETPQSSPPKSKLTQKKKDLVIKRLKDTQHLYEELYGNDGHVPHTHKEGAGLTDIRPLRDLSQDRVAKLVKEMGGSVKNKNGMNHYRIPKMKEPSEESLAKKQSKMREAALRVMEKDDHADTVTKFMSQHGDPSFTIGEVKKRLKKHHDIDLSHKEIHEAVIHHNHFNKDAHRKIKMGNMNKRNLKDREISMHPAHKDEILHSYGYRRAVV